MIHISYIIILILVPQLDSLVAKIMDILIDFILGELIDFIQGKLDSFINFDFVVTL